MTTLSGVTKETKVGVCRASLSVNPFIKKNMRKKRPFVSEM